MEEMTQPYHYNSLESSMRRSNANTGSQPPVSSATATARAVVIEGLPDERRTSPIRRTFLLFVLFDFIGSFIMWVLYTQLMAYSSISEALKQEVVHYSFRTSMFDIVVLAFWRFAILELSYGVLKFNKPWSAAVATTCTCIACLVKIFYYDFQHKIIQVSGRDVFDYVLIITSFLLTWLETWFLDFRVLPKEKAARELNYYDETTPLLRDRNMPNDFAPSERYFSPIASSNESEAEEGADPSAFQSPLYASPGFDVEVHRQKAAEMFAAAMRIMDEEQDWHVDTRRPNIGTVYTNRSVKGKKNIYKLEGMIDVPPPILYRDMVDNIAECPEWNTTLSESRRLQMVDENTDVIYNVVKELLAGAVSSRDFVIMRRWAALDDGRLAIASESVEHPLCPPKRDHVRGVNGPTCVLLEAVQVEGRDHTDFRWMLDSDPKGWIPSRLTDQAMASAMFQFMESLHRRAEVLRARLSMVSVNNSDTDDDEEGPGGVEHFLSTKSTPS